VKCVDNKIGFRGCSREDEDLKKNVYYIISVIIIRVFPNSKFESKVTSIKYKTTNT